MNDDGRRMPSLWRNVRGVVLFAVAFCVSASCVWRGASEAVKIARIEPVGLALSMAENLREWRRRLARDRAHERVALIGDSTMMVAEGMDPRRETLPARVVQALRQRGAIGRRIRIHTLCQPALGPAGIYFASDELARARPDRIVLSLSIAGFSPGGLKDFSYAEISGWLRPEHLWEAARLPFLQIGLTFDRVLLYQGIVAVGAVDLWRDTRQLQARVFKLPGWLGDTVERKLGLTTSVDMQFVLGIARWQRMFVPGRKRWTRPAGEQSFAAVLQGLTPENPALQMLGSALERFRVAGIPTLVYLRPVNVEHLRSLGISTAHLRESLLTLQRTVLSHGAQLVDLHALLPDSAFSDAGDHYTFQGAPNGAAWLGDRIANAIVETEPKHGAATGTNVAVQ
jgi:hypothetical protein